MKKITSKKLSNYGAMSAALLATAAASGQVLYTDIDDVTVVASTGGSIDIDLNGDAIVDYAIQMSVVTNGVSFTITPDAANVDGAFQGISAAGFEYPALLAVDDLVDGSAVTAAGTRGDLNYYGCAYANSEFCGDVTDGYIGLVFDFDGATHYGWARLDSSVAAGPGTMEGSFTLKDYALELTPDTPIAAGDEGEPLGVNDQLFAGFNFFVSNEQLNLSAANAMDNVTIYSLLGQQVVDQKLSGTNGTVSLAGLSTGAYVAKVSIDGAIKTIKFVK